MYFLDRNNDSLDTIIFCGIFLLGVTTQIIGRLLFEGSAFVVILFLLAYLIGYAVLVYKGTYTKIARSQAADNFYYMGFLFTISSLSIALYKFGHSDKTQQDTLRIIVADLGIGLSTTIVGLLLRTMFTQFRNSPEEIEDRVTITLKQRAKEVESNFLVAIRAFESTNVRLQELTRRTEENIQVALDPFPQRIAKIHEYFEKSVNETMRTFATKLAAKLNEVDELDLPIDEINAKWRSILNEMNELELPPDILKIKFEEALQEIDNFKRRIGDVNLDINMDELNESLSKQSQQISNINMPVSILKDSIEEVAQHLKNLGGQLNNIRIPDDSLANATVSIVNDLENKMSRTSDAITIDLEKAKNNLVKTMQEKQVEINDIEVSISRKLINLFKRKLINLFKR